MGWFDGWPFKTKEQTERERKAFEQRVFPLGEAQRAAALAVLDQIITGKRMNQSDKLYAFIMAKDRYELDERTVDAEEAARRQLLKMQWLPENEMDLLMALVRLDAQVEDLSEYPTLEEVRRSAGQHVPSQ